MQNPYLVIPLTKGKSTLIDKEDLEKISNHSWHYGAGGVAAAGTHIKVEGVRKSVAILMHRIILNAPKDKHVDHINGNRLDNRKENLRLCTRSQNMHNMTKKKNNTSGYKGVVFNKEKWRINQWVARITVNNKVIWLGRFFTKEEAARAYQDAEEKYMGEFRRVL